MTAEQERAAIVAWLRRGEPSGKASWRVKLWFITAAIFRPREIALIAYEVIADAIERGDHLKSETPGEP